MPDPSLTSPNTGNYYIGKGVLSFQAEGEVTYRDLGNCSNFSITSDMVTLDHFSSRAGVKEKDLSIILEKNATVNLTLDEYTPANMAIKTLGTLDEAAVGGAEIDIFTQNAVVGALKFVGANEVGPQITVDLYNVSFKPSGDQGFITDEFGEMELEGDILIAGAGPNVGKRGKIKYTNIPLVS